MNYYFSFAPFRHVGTVVLIDLKLLGGLSAYLFCNLDFQCSPGLTSPLLTAFLGFKQSDYFSQEREVGGDGITTWPQLQWVLKLRPQQETISLWCLFISLLCLKFHFPHLSISPKQPLVGHNMMMDLLHLHEKFFRPLPGRGTPVALLPLISVCHLEGDGPRILLWEEPQGSAGLRPAVPFTVPPPLRGGSGDFLTGKSLHLN